MRSIASIFRGCCRIAAIVPVASVLGVPSALRAQQTAPAASPTASSAAADTVEGVVYDSIRSEPVAGAVVQVVSRTSMTVSYSAETDTLGRFRLLGVPPGSYLIGFLDPVLEELGLSSVQRSMELGPDTRVHVQLFIPGARAIRTTLCGKLQPQDSSGMLLGFVRDAGTTFPIGSATVVAVWQEITIGQKGFHRVRREVPAKADSSGWYAICGLPTDGGIAVRAELGRRATGFIEVNVPPAGLLVRDFSLGSDTATVAARDTVASPLGEPVRHGTARLVGVVHDPAGKPLTGAHLTVWGAGAVGVSDAHGRFAFEGLPAGTQTLEANYLGFAPLRMAVDLAAGRVDTVDAQLTKPVQVLGAVQVYGKKSSRSFVTEFERRREAGLGRYITAMDIEKRRPYQMTDLFYSMPGMRVVPDANFDYGIVSSRSATTCYPSVYIDGAPVPDAARSLNTYVQPGDILGMEVYADGSTVPLQYRVNDCGAVLIWTK